MPEVNPSLATSLVTDLRIEHLPAFESNTKAAHAFFFSQRAWHPATDLYLDDVLTVAIFPDRAIFSFISKLIESASTENTLNAKTATNDFNLNILGGP